MEFNAELERSEYIDRYLRGELAEAEQIAFERKLQEDAALSEEVERARSVRSLLKNYGLRQDLKAIHARKMAKRREQTSFRWLHSTPLRIAASIVLLLVCAFVIRMATLSPEGLYTKVSSYQPDIVRGDENTPSSPGHMMLLEYANGNYSNVTRIFEQMRNHSTEDTFIASNAYLALDQPDKAITGFRKVMQDGSQLGNRYFQDAEYYLAWAYLKNGQINEAEALFTKIHDDSSHRYHKNVGTWFYWQVKLLKWKSA